MPRRATPHLTWSQAQIPGTERTLVTVHLTLHLTPEGWEPGGFSVIDTLNAEQLALEALPGRPCVEPRHALARVIARAQMAAEALVPPFHP